MALAIPATRKRARREAEFGASFTSPTTPMMVVHFGGESKLMRLLTALSPGQ